MQGRSIIEGDASVIAEFMLRRAMSNNPGGAVENSPAFQRGVRVPKGKQVPQGREEISAAPTGFEQIATVNPSDESLGYFRQSLRDFPGRSHGG
jgi:hypothetical protein